MAPSDVDPRIERTRRLVIDAAIELVSQEGFDNTTVEAIADRCGVARSTIYRHWENRNDLVVQAMKSQIVAAETAPTGDLRTDLVEFMKGMAGWLSTPQGAMMALAALTAAQRDPEIRRIQVRGTRGRRAALAAILDDALAAGELRPGLDTTEAATDLLGPLFTRRFLTHEPIDAAYLERRVDRWLEAHRAR